eukprot:365566-Pyramimonas_sp.AAC.1
MRSLCHRFQVVAPSTFLPAPIDDTHNTHVQTDGKTCKRLGYVLLPQEWFSLVSCARVDGEVDPANAVEDHSPTFVE